MNQIILEGSNLTNVRLQVKDIDDAIEQLKKLKTQHTHDRINSIMRFKGICTLKTNFEVCEEGWYAQ